MKRFLKRIMLAVAAVFCCSAAMALADAPTLVVSLRSGATECYALAKKPVIRYGAETMTIEAEGVETTYEVGAVENFHFEGDLEANAIKAQEANSFSFRQTAPGVFTIEGSDGATLTNLSGQTLKSFKAAEQITIDLSAQAAGVYIISVKSGNRNQSVKILKK